MITFSNFTKRYKPSSKTLRFTLIPHGKTQEQINKLGILNQDVKRAENYEKAKKILDNFYKEYLNESLLKINYDWQPLFDAHENYRLTKDDTLLKEVREKSIKAISKLVTSDFKKDDKHKPKKIIDEILKNKQSVSESEYEAISQFNKFTTYFEGYRENRENIFGEKQNSAPYRMVVENFSKFYINICKYEALPFQFKNELQQRANKVLNGAILSDIFTINYYNKSLSQEGIEKYNNVLNGYTLEDGTKIQGLNELCNLAYQQTEINKKVVFEPLYKQILTDRSTLSFVIQSYDSDTDLLQNLCSHLENISAVLKDKNNELKCIFTSNKIDLNSVFVRESEITYLSQILFERWDTLKESLKKKKFYTVQEIQGVYTAGSVFEKIRDCYANLYLNFINAYNDVLPILSYNVIQSYTEIKNCLDSILALEKLLKIFIANEESEKDYAFYSVIESVYVELRASISVYNMVRNYATKKEYVEEKYKINFNLPTLGDGWDKSKEKDNNCIILVKDGRYYLGIYNAKDKAYVTERESDCTSNSYKKMVYKLLPGPNKMLPKVFLSEKGIKMYNPSEYILKNYDKGRHRKGDGFDLQFCHDLIDYFKDGINKNQDWKVFNFKFSPTETYQDISQFYKEIDSQAYKMTYTYVEESEVDKLVEEGKLFLFQIYNKDFSEKSTGNKNLHTLYWEQIFSDENAEKPVFQLCGGAELFYRGASIENPFIHRKGSVLIRKTNKDKTQVDERLYIQATEDAKKMGIVELKEKYPSLDFRIAPHDIVKNRRFSQAQYKFHCPIAFNYNSNGEENQKQFNQTVAKEIANNNEFNVIGIDRGERHLLYVSVIDRKGKIILQKSLNEINGVNYHDKLAKVAQQRNEQRKNWQTIENIKELKKGYLSLAVNEISKLMVENNAVIVMESLNRGFKTSRTHIEQQTYQNFEIALLQKLNYLAFKDRKPYDAGGIANAYQLSAKYESFDKVGTQSGFVFYVPAGYTSKIDPATGFVNLFTSKHLKYENVLKAQEFFGKFNSIIYNETLGFVFEFDYSNFGINECEQTLWSACTGNSSRVIFKSNRITGFGEYEEVLVTEELKKLFTANGILLSGDLKSAILQQGSKQFYERLLWLFSLTMRLRYSNSNEDYILSPILKNGEFFDSRNSKENMPLDGDANGAYHIALKGLRLITSQINSEGSIVLDKKGDSNKAWFNYAKNMAKSK